MKTSSLGILNRLLFLTGISSLILGSLTWAQAQEEEEEYDGPLYMKPATPRTPFSSRVNKFFMDGLDGEDFRIQTPKFEIMTAVPNAWSRRPDPATSISFYFRGDRKVTCSLSLYKKDEFLPDIEREAIKGYIEGLKIKYKKRVQILNDDGNYRPTGQSTQPLDRLNRVVIYSLVAPGGAGRTVHYEYFLLAEGDLIVGSFSGPVDKLDIARRSFEQFFYTMSIAEEEEV